MADSAAKDEKDEDDSARRVEREEMDLALVQEVQLECGSSQSVANPQQQTLRSESREASRGNEAAPQLVVQRS